MKLFIYQAGGMGRVFLETARKLNENRARWEEIAFIDDDSEDDEVQGAPVYRYHKVLELNRTQGLECIIAAKEPFDRQLIAEKLKADHLPLTNLIHPDAILPDNVRLGQGIFIGPQTAIGPCVSIGDNVFLEGDITLGHDVSVGSHSVLSARAFVAGHTAIGSCVFIGAGTILKDRITIHDKALIMLGSVVTRSVREGKAVMGNPGKTVGINERFAQSPAHSSLSPEVILKCLEGFEGLMQLPLAPDVLVRLKGSSDADGAVNFKTAGDIIKYLRNVL